MVTPEPPKHGIVKSSTGSKIWGSKLGRCQQGNSVLVGLIVMVGNVVGSRRQHQP